MTAYDEEFLSKVFDSVTDPFSIYDPDLRIIKANKAFADLVDCRPEEIVGKYCYEVFYHRTAICEDCHVKEVFHTGEPRMLEKRIALPDGTERVIEVYSYPVKDGKGNTIQAIEHGRDITERKRLVNQLLASKDFNAKIINSITDNLTVLDPKTRRIIQANESFCARVGLKHSTITTKRCYEIMRNSPTPCEANGIECAVQDTLQSKCSSLSDRVYPDAGGEDRVLQIATYPIFDDQGKISSIVRLERDVTEKREMEKALADRSKELQRAQHQLEKLFEISRQVSAKDSLIEIVDYVYDIAQEIFPNPDALIFLLDAGGQNFFDLEGCNPNVMKVNLRAQQELERSGLLTDFVQYLQRIREPQIISSENSEDIPGFLNFISMRYPKWFSFPCS